MKGSPVRVRASAPPETPVFTGVFCSRDRNDIRRTPGWATDWATSRRNDPELGNYWVHGGAPGDVPSGPAAPPPSIRPGFRPGGQMLSTPERGAGERRDI